MNFTKDPITWHVTPEEAVALAAVLMSAAARGRST